jgi:hypothetical protein
MKKLFKKFMIIIFSIMMLISCSSSIEIEAKSDKSLKLDFALNLGKVISDTFYEIENNFSENGSSGEEKNFFHEETIKVFLEKNGFSNTKVLCPSYTELIMAGDLLFQEQKNMGNFISNSGTSLSLNINPESIQNLCLTDESYGPYFDLLMAPIFTNEEMTSSEYIELISAVYGKELAKEFDNSCLEITLKSPKGTTIKKNSILGVEDLRISQSVAKFKLPLKDFLCLREAKTYSISW